MLGEIYTALLDFLLPPRCPVCGAYCDKEGAWCPACLQKTICCHRLPLRAGAYHSLQMVQAAGHYRGGMKKLIQQVKYQKKMAALKYIHTFLAAALCQTAAFRPDYVVPVPLYAAKQKCRGFNQAEKIFRPWAEEKGYRWLDALVRTKLTRPQYELSLRERQKNMKNAFALKNPLPENGKNILLVDDIFTTGATLEACAAVLKKAGAARIEGLVLASDSQ